MESLTEAISEIKWTEVVGKKTVQKAIDSDPKRMAQVVVRRRIPLLKSSTLNLCKVTRE